MNLILLGADEVAPDGSATLTDIRARHITTVLRAEVGSTVRIGLLNGPVGTATITAINGPTVTLHNTFDPEPPPTPRVDILLAVPRPKVLRRLWAPLASLGVGRIILTNASKVERDYFDTHLIAPSGYVPSLIEGLQQARDTRIPEVSVHKQFRKLVEDEIETLSPGTRRLIAHPGAATSVRQALAEGAADRVLVAVGPEGGWNDFERNLLASRGFVEVGLGQRPLTTTTACIALLTLVHDAIR